jgi:hypothetical protein
MNRSSILTAAHVRPGRRLLASAAAAALALAGSLAYLAANAASAHAGTVNTVSRDISINPGSTRVGLATVRTTVTYTCTDTSAPHGRAAVRVSFDQHGNDTSGEVAVPCGSGDVNKTQTVTATQLGMSGSQEITAVATLDDGATAASDTADTVANQFIVHLDPTVTYPGNGTVTLTGFYNCAATVPTPSKIIITATQDTTSNVASAGLALVDVTTCNSTDQSFSVTITGSTSGDPFISADDLEDSFVHSDHDVEEGYGA